MEIWFHSEIKNPKGLCMDTTQKYCVSIMPEINIAEWKSKLKYSVAGTPQWRIYNHSLWGQSSTTRSNASEVARYAAPSCSWPHPTTVNGFRGGWPNWNIEWPLPAPFIGQDQGLLDRVPGLGVRMKPDTWSPSCPSDTWSPSCPSDTWSPSCPSDTWSPSFPCSLSFIISFRVKYLWIIFT